MNQSRLVKSLEKLSNREKELFHDFVISPYFNQHEKTIELLSLILEELPKASPQLSRMSIFQRLFPKKKYDEQKLHNVMSYLMRLFHRFLAFQQFEGTIFEEQLSTIEKSYTDSRWDMFKNRSKFFERTAKQYKKLDSEYHHAQYRYHYMMGKYKNNHISRSDTKTFQGMLHHLDNYYVLEKLKQSCELTAHQMIMNTTYDFGFLDDLLKYMDRHWEFYEKHATIASYYTILRMLNEDDNPRYYKHLKVLIKDHSSSYTRDDHNLIHNFASNFCILRINRGDKDYEKELFELYQQGLENEVLLENGSLDSWVYKNITTLGCRLKQFGWTKDFIEDYREKLSDSQSENAYNYNLAVYYFSMDSYDQAQSLLLRVQFTEVQYHLGGNFLLIRTYYAQDDTEALLSLLETMRLYVLRSKKMTTKEKKGYMNLFRFTKKLVYLRYEYPMLKSEDFEKRVSTLSEKIKTTDNVIGRSWLREEITEIEEKKMTKSW